MSSDTEVSPMAAPRYARFSRRLRAMLIDWIITLIVMFGAVWLAASVGNDNFSRGIGILAVVVLVLYEPILVSRMGGTLGHYFTNLRVVDDRDGGNIGFARACARVVVKGVLGLYSFVILAATRRNQAVHDLLTRSTVQIRDRSESLARSIHCRAHRTCGRRPAVAVAADRRDMRLSVADGGRLSLHRRLYCRARGDLPRLSRRRFLLGRREDSQSSSLAWGCSDCAPSASPWGGEAGLSARAAPLSAIPDR